MPLCVEPNGMFTAALSVDTWPDWVRRQQKLSAVSVRFPRLLWPASAASPLYILVAYAILWLLLVAVALFDCLNCCWETAQKDGALHSLRYYLLPDRAEYTRCSDGVISFSLYVGHSVDWVGGRATEMCTYARHGLRSWALHPYVICLFICRCDKVFCSVAPRDLIFFFCGRFLYVCGCLRISPSGFCR